MPRKTKERILRELLERLTAATEMTDVVIAAGIAMQDLDPDTPAAAYGEA